MATEAVAEPELHTPESAEALARMLADAGADGLTARVRGAGTKLSWGAPVTPGIEIGSGRLNRILEHNEGDLTAVLEAGVPLAEAQRRFARAGQMLALDPPVGAGATIGGILATGDSGPLRHRFGAPRDLVLGMTVALSDGTLARSGGRVIKNVAGYDVGKLFCGAFGTLGAIVSVSVRLHPLQTEAWTALGATQAPGTQAAAVRALATSGLELDALDVAWRAGRGGVAARVSGPRAAARAARTADLMKASGLQGVDLAAQDDGLWARQRAGQRSQVEAVVRVAARPSQLPLVVMAAQDAGGTLVGRGGVGLSWVAVPAPAVEEFRLSLPAGTRAVLLDGPETLRRSLQVWGPGETNALSLMRRVKQSFDPDGVMNPGVFLGGI